MLRAPAAVATLTLAACTGTAGASRAARWTVVSPHT
jgi:hypothetical protein